MEEDRLKMLCWVVTAGSVFSIAAVALIIAWNLGDIVCLLKEMVNQ